MPKKGELKSNATARSKEQRKFNGTETQKKRRAQRNKARREAEKDGRVSKGDGKDLDHKDRDTKNNSKKNTRVTSRKKNRSHGGKVGSKAGKRKGGLKGGKQSK